MEASKNSPVTLKKAAHSNDVHIGVRNLTVLYNTGTLALSNVNIDLYKGQFVVILGSSGAGKSTFIRSLNRLVQPTTGEIWMGKQNIVTAKGNELRRHRQQAAMIFQQFNLIKRMTVLRNVLVGRLGYKTAFESVFPIFTQPEIDLALSSLERLGILDKAYIRADRLSGGQQQRVAIARALTQQPSIILADEPVASLDPETAIVVLDILKRISQEDGITTIVNLHQWELAQDYADRVLGFKHGKLIFDGTTADMSREVYERIYK